MELYKHCNSTYKYVGDPFISTYIPYFQIRHA